MPELPEMENYRRLLNQRIADHVITDVQINREKSINVKPELFINSVLHQKVTTVDRRAKHLLFHLQNGQVLLLHLMLGGWMFYGTEEEKPKRTIQIRLSFGYQHLYFIGLRLGYLHLYNENAVQQELSDLGPEPLESSFTLEAFLKLMDHKRGKIKAKLLDQGFIAGIGNCYSDEICYHSGILPTREIQEIRDEEKSHLFDSMKNVLTDALNHGGYLENPFFIGDTKTGSYNQFCKVYDREKQPCFRCRTPIEKTTIASRKSFFCPVCQK
ncbi:bifunctional DNA-formamidopyrimidine glycosylase/DNA-(apurinic or apyrimidinic site) lyase [Bacillus salipaludis]|uniref:Formamidopyrimidine-DNA glycosylase n=1 Tax=Bacillus salipaludis TaxID=2547811 RepID=A0AA90R2H7_9BACI|nr:bifunctional DNA-formamidopyrimidine glycosylase/DNA-(apurinic or apyrimidinic site) lyase [Bacillus salipaludis]MDQ6598988.1 bifunctional DNA-formamidopyrimidine glycosylase/DNA-(apurinic or apyrimidinic site) lyase [Bacillus salipaludis]